MRDLDDFMAEVRTHAPNCPDPLAYRHIRDVARELCRAGHIWRDNDAFEVSSPECEGIITVQDAEAIEVENARLNDVTLTPKTIGWLDDNLPEWQDQAENSSARYLTQLAPNTFTVVPKATGLIRIRLVLIPSRTADTLPDFLYDEYGSQIGAAAAGRVMLTPGQDFTNPQLALKLEGDFSTVLARVKIRAAKGRQGARLRTKGSFF